MTSNTASTLLGAILLCAMICASAASAEDPVVADGNQVRMEYTLTLEDGTVVDTTIGRGPLLFVQGQHQLLRSLERELAGMKMNERKKVVITPADAYGERDPGKLKEVPVANIPKEYRAVGETLMGESPEGMQMAARVHEVTDDLIVVDFNHPLAGRILTFDVKIISIE